MTARDRFEERMEERLAVSEARRRLAEIQAKDRNLRIAKIAFVACCLAGVLATVLIARACR